MALRQKNLQQARLYVGRMVGRRTDALSRESIIRACVESTAENLSDALIAPVFYFGVGVVLAKWLGASPEQVWIFGLSLAIFFRHVNLMDSLYGYRNREFLDFGWASARLDDICSFLPARISAGLIIACSGVLSVQVDFCCYARAIFSRSFNPREKSFPKHNPAASSPPADFPPPPAPPLLSPSPALVFSKRQAFLVWLRDRICHESPNAGQSEAAMAGALQIVLGGTNQYAQKKTVQAPLLGRAPISSSSSSSSESESESFYARMHPRWSIFPLAPCHILRALTLTSLSFLAWLFIVVAAVSQ